MHITGSSIDDPLDFDVGFFNDAGDIDLKKQMWAYKKHREILRRANYFRGELASGHPKFPADSKAAVVVTEIALSDVRDLEYSREDDEAIEQFLRENVNTTWHSLGTCKMAPREEDGVVDAELNVYGVKGLVRLAVCRLHPRRWLTLSQKIADLSIPPENVGANTNNTALVIGEKAADIILNDLGLKKGRGTYLNGQPN
jgi:hypothetical protein